MIYVVCVGWYKYKCMEEFRLINFVIVEKYVLILYGVVFVLCILYWFVNFLLGYWVMLSI